MAPEAGKQHDRFRMSKVHTHTKQAKNQPTNQANKKKTKKTSAAYVSKSCKDSPPSEILAWAGTRRSDAANTWRS